MKEAERNRIWAWIGLVIGLASIVTAWAIEFYTIANEAFDQRYDLGYLYWAALIVTLVSLYFLLEMDEERTTKKPSIVIRILATIGLSVSILILLAVAALFIYGENGMNAIFDYMHPIFLALALAVFPFVNKFMKR